VSLGLLIREFDLVDLVESDLGFLKQAEVNLKQRHPICEIKGKVEMLICKGLEEFEPEEGRYDVIWNQWVLSHLTDEDLIKYLKKCLSSVRVNGGYVVVKENVVRGHLLQDYCLDEEDSSVTRSERVWLRIFAESGGRLVKSAKQPNFPPHLFPVHLWALK
jgi:protein N-terminal methyltransferase